MLKSTHIISYHFISYRIVSYRVVSIHIISYDNHNISIFIQILYIKKNIHKTLIHTYTPTPTTLPSPTNRHTGSKPKHDIEPESCPKQRFQLQMNKTIHSTNNQPNNQPTNQTNKQKKHANKVMTQMKVLLLLLNEITCIFR